MARAFMLQLYMYGLSKCAFLIYIEREVCTFHDLVANDDDGDNTHRHFSIREAFLVYGMARPRCPA